MDLDLIAFDSFGVKSSCIFLRTGEYDVIIDPGVAFEADSFPMPLWQRLAYAERYEMKIRKYVKKADIVVITHYHYDHHIPDPKIYKGKILLVKDPKKNINRSQFERAKFLQDVDSEVRIADGKSFSFGNLNLDFSRPRFHGVRGTNLGYVISLIVSDGKKKILYSSDLNGPILPEYARQISREKPDLLILDGFPTYLLGFIAAYYNLARAVLNLEKMIKSGIKEIILDHHLLRDYRYRDLYKVAFDSAKERGVWLGTAAEYLGKEPAVMRFYKKNGPTRWKNWKPLERRDLARILQRAKKLGLIKNL